MSTPHYYSTSIGGLTIRFQLVNEPIATIELLLTLSSKESLVGVTESFSDLRFALLNTDAALDWILHLQHIHKLDYVPRVRHLFLCILSLNVHKPHVSERNVGVFTKSSCAIT